MKTDLELEKMSTRNLLVYYRAERKRNHVQYANLVCECCGEFNHDLGGSLEDKIKGEKAVADNAEHDKYLEHIKEILSKRENVEKNDNRKRIN